MEPDGPDPSRPAPSPEESEAAGPSATPPGPASVGPALPFILDYRRPEPEPGRRHDRAPFEPLGSFFVANFLTGAATTITAIVFLRTSAMEDAIPCLACGSFTTAPVSTIAFGCGMWLRGRLTNYALETRAWWAQALCGCACALVAVAALYLPEGYANFGAAALTLLCPVLAGAASLRKPARP